MGAAASAVWHRRHSHAELIPQHCALIGFFLLYERLYQGSDRTAFPERERFDVNFRAPNTTYDAGPARTFSNLEPEQNT